MNRHWLGFELSVLRRIKFNSVAVPFAGQPDLDWYLKFWNKKVLNNDVCWWSWWTSRALVENQTEMLTEGDVTQVLRDTYVPPRRLSNPALTRFLSDQDATWFDNLWLNIQHLGSTHQQALAYHHALGAMDYVHSFNRQNSHLRRPLSEVFRTLWQTQRRVFDNAQENHSSSLDGTDFITATTADLMYLRFPRPQGLKALRHSVIGWREIWIRGTGDCWDDLIAHRRGRPGDSVLSKEHYLKLLREFLQSARHIPKWAVAHADDGFVTAAEMGELIREFRPVEVAYNKDFSEIPGGLNTYLIIA
jgi:hypothetical protein